MSMENFVDIFNESISDYHIYDNINTSIINPYLVTSIEGILYQKNWIDTFQWHFEDIIREPNIDPIKALELKRNIDIYNQKRTDIVELIDDYYFEKFVNTKLQSNYKLNTETIGWAIDRLSIACLKIYHMKVEVERKDANQMHLDKCKAKLDVLLQQQNDLQTSIAQLASDIQNGIVKNLRYKQMKMYNDPSMNPILYTKK